MEDENEWPATNGLGERATNQLSVKHTTKAPNEKQESKRALAWSSEQCETFRRIRLGELRRVSHWRYGPVLPDDDAGHEELNLRFKVISLGDFPEVRMKREAEIYAPWMSAADVDEAIQQVMQEPKLLHMMDV
jgi:hypothetical protein